MTIENNQLNNMLVSLDVLLDARAGVLTLLNHDALKAMLKNNKYQSRLEDVFPGVDMAVYKEAYKNRTKEALQNTILTKMMVYIKDIVVKIVDDLKIRPFYVGCKVTVNIHPYDLTVDEINDLGDCVNEWIDGIAQVEIVNLPLEAITPEFCKNNYTMLFLYDYSEWLELHAERFKKTRIPDITLFAPALYFNPKPNDDELKRTVDEVMHPMRAIELIASPIVELQLLDAEYFSIPTIPVESAA